MQQNTNPSASSAPDWIINSRKRRGRSSLSKKERQAARKTRRLMGIMGDPSHTFKDRVIAWCSLHGTPKTKQERVLLCEDLGVKDNTARGIIIRHLA